MRHNKYCSLARTYQMSAKTTQEDEVSEETQVIVERIKLQIKLYPELYKEHRELCAITVLLNARGMKNATTILELLHTLSNDDFLDGFIIHYVYHKGTTEYEEFFKTYPGYANSACFSTWMTEALRRFYNNIIPSSYKFSRYSLPLLYAAFKDNNVDQDIIEKIKLSMDDAFVNDT